MGKQTAPLALVLCLIVPGLHAQSGSVTTYSKTEVTTYYDDTAKWVLGQTASVTCTVSVPASSSCDGDVVSAATYSSNAQLLTSKSYGKLQQTLTYNTDGTVATVKDGNSNVISVSNWKRGIPQTISYPGSVSESAVVSDQGWLTSVTDENGYKTCYTYDGMGRITKVTYPSESTSGVCDTSAWNATTLVFEKVNSAEYGIPAGHWRQTVTTGNGKKIVYFDAMWRPLVTREYDTANEAATKRFQRFVYDWDGSTTFASYPGTSDGLSTGTWSEYDALGRPISISQDSEQGLLATLTEYLPGFQIRVTNPRGTQTATQYQAWDRPTTEFPTGVTTYAGTDTAATVIARDAQGEPTAITRRNSDGSVSLTRSYTYNANQELCRAVEPETGATLYGYDAAGNLKWSAAGLPTDTACETNGTSTTVAARRVDRSYDAR
ncbi:MAG: RHS repeat protein, partial [Pseudoxanthomonas sp.]